MSEQQMDNSKIENGSIENGKSGMPKALKWLTGLIILAGIGYGGWYLGNKYSAQKQENGTPKPTAPIVSEKTTPAKTETPKPTVTKIIDPGVTWLEKPEKLGDLNLFNSKNVSSEITSYYKTATLAGGGELIYATISEMGTAVYRFKKNADGTYLLLTNHSDNVSDVKSLLNNELYDAGKITQDTTIRYNSLSASSLLSVDSINYKSTSSGFDYNELFENLEKRAEESNKANDNAQTTSYSKLSTSGYGDLYKYTFTNKLVNIKVSDEKYFVKLADTTVEWYTLAKDFLADDGSLVTTLNDSYVNYKDRKFNIGFTATKCGRGSAEQIYSENLSDRVEKIGTSPSGQSLYTLNTKSDELLKTAYETYKVGRDYPGSSDKLLSYDLFVGKSPLLIWKNPFEKYEVFMDKDYDALAECGKPVVYLYPEKDTKVSVKVGADVKISEPEYKNGWDVLAKPSGELIWNGQKFNSLYWEGKGQGIYPSITQGRVVESKNIETELRSDLGKMGLNIKESQDFIDFWLSRMPTQKYTRLTWFGTKQMDALAPLTITPKPDSVIRVFLDFAGQDSSETNLNQQNLTSIPRTGFTAVEWGGLLIGK